MKIFVFDFTNHSSRGRRFRVLAHSKEEAWEILEKEQRKYLHDDETFFMEDSTIEIDKPMLIK